MTASSMTCRRSRCGRLHDRGGDDDGHGRTIARVARSPRRAGAGGIRAGATILAGVRMPVAPVIPVLAVVGSSLVGAIVGSGNARRRRADRPGTWQWTAHDGRRCRGASPVSSVPDPAALHDHLRRPAARFLATADCNTSPATWRTAAAGAGRPAVRAADHARRPRRSWHAGPDSLSEAFVDDLASGGELRRRGRRADDHARRRRVDDVPLAVRPPALARGRCDSRSGAGCERRVHLPRMPGDRGA